MVMLLGIKEKMVFYIIMIQKESMEVSLIGEDSVLTTEDLDKLEEKKKHKKKQKKQN